ALIRTQVFPTYAPDDWSWVRASSELASLDAETPHAIIGMIVLSMLIWLFARSLAQNGGDYIARRNAFLRLFALLIVAIVLGLLTARDEVAFSEALALYLPAYTLLGLITLSQVRLVEVRAQMSQTGAGGRRAVAIWRLVTVGLALTSLILVFVLTAIFYGGSYQQAIAEGLAIWGRITDALATIIIWLTLPIVEALSPFTPRPTTTQAPKGCVLPTETPGATPTPTSTPTAPCAPGNQNSIPNGAGALSANEVQSIYIATLTIVFLILTLIIYLRTRKALGMTKAGEYEEEREHLDLRGSRQAQPQPAPALGIIDAPAPGSARAAYQAFLRASASAKLPREPNETPAEFQDRVRPEIGDAALETTVEDLTAGYEAERYGGERLPAARLTGLQEAARAIAAAFARLRDRRK
ncbi:MAG: DUF4129 domain-containing protein, partial [Ktedonobacterales bacterium]|nr:DUF4129 domain-containing protein [Ktedonobacterales bacterium]